MLIGCMKGAQKLSAALYGWVYQHICQLRERALGYGDSLRNMDRFSRVHIRKATETQLSRRFARAKLRSRLGWGLLARLVAGNTGWQECSVGGARRKVLVVEFNGWVVVNDKIEVMAQ